MIKTDDTLNLAKAVGSGVEFGLQQRLSGCQYFQIVLRTVTHQQFTAPQGRLQRNYLLFVESDALPCCLPLDECVVNFGTGIQQALPEQRNLVTDKIGIENCKKRLTLLYPGKHTLEIVKKDGKFLVTLSMNLQ